VSNIALLKVVVEVGACFAVRHSFPTQGGLSIARRVTFASSPRVIGSAGRKMKPPPPELPLMIPLAASVSIA